MIDYLGWYTIGTAIPTVLTKINKTIQVNLHVMFFFHTETLFNAEAPSLVENVKCRSSPIQLVLFKM